MSDTNWREAALHLAQATNLSWREIAKTIDKPRSTVSDFLRTKPEAEQGPKIGLLDIETSPTLAWVWRRWKENIGQPQVEEETIILSAAVKELGKEDVEFCAAWQEDDPLDDLNVVSWLKDKLNAYDILIAHNGDKFDFPIINTRLVYHGYTPPVPYKTVDTLKILKKRFRFPSNALNSVSQYLGLGAKMPHEGFDLWKGVMHGDVGCRVTMEKYNIHDVVLLEELYTRIRAWDHGHPSMAIRTDGDIQACNVCGSTHVHKAEAKHYTSVSAFDLYNCGDCGHWMRGRTNTVAKDKRDVLGVSVA